MYSWQYLSNYNFFQFVVHETCVYVNYFGKWNEKGLPVRRLRFVRHRVETVKKKKKKKKKEKKRNNPKKIRTEINREFVKQRAIVTTSLTENFWKNFALIVDQTNVILRKRRLPFSFYSFKALSLFLSFLLFLAISLINDTSNMHLSPSWSHCGLG